MDKLLNRWAAMLRQALRLPEMESEVAQLKVLLEAQEMRTAATLAVLACQQQQMAEQLRTLQKVVLQTTQTTTSAAAYNRLPNPQPQNDDSLL